MPIPFERSFASNPKHLFWSKKNKKQPRECYKSTVSKYLFDCNLCEHEFETSLKSITNMNTWCCFCANKKLCDKSDCKLCYDKSFATHEKSIFWSSKNENLPREMFKSSNKNCLFDCVECGHEFEIQLGNITHCGNWCSYCSHQKLCEKDDCNMCLNNSFSSHYKSIYWSSKNEKKPREVFKCSNLKYLFNCEYGHEFQISLSNITNCGHWCSICVNKTETKLYEKMILLFPSIKTQFKQEWCKNKLCLPFDFCIPEPKIIIELDGEQHFIQVMNWPTHEEHFERDKYKEKCANDNGYSTIRIIQNDVWRDKYDWCKELCETIENIKNGNKVVKKYLCKNGEYDKFIQNIV